MGCARLLQMGERNPSKFHEGNSSQMLVGVGKEQVCQNPEIQMGLWAGRGGGGETTQMCWGLYLPAHSLSEEEPRNLRWVGSLPPPACQAPPSLEPSPFNTPDPPLGPVTSSSRLL